MNIQEQIYTALKDLTVDGLFQIVQFKYDEDNFGNILIELKSTINVGIRFIKDRGISWCELRLDKEWYLFEDVSAYFKIEKMNNNGSLIDVITQSSAVLRKNLAKIVEACDSEFIKDIQSRIRDIGMKRAMDIFKSSF